MCETLDSSIDLWGECGDFALASGWWSRMLTLAQQYGWQPQGTEPPDPMWEWDGDPATWEGSYWPAVGQQVSAADAQALGEALERALPDIPDHDALRDTGLAPYRGYLDVPIPAGTTALELLSGEGKRISRQFIEHCRSCGPLDVISYR
jgi:hypothetical protein